MRITIFETFQAGNFMTIRQIPQQFKTSDGSLFDTSDAAEAHEN